MIGNPFLYRAADVRTGSMAEVRNFVNLFGISALGLIRDKMDKLWDFPLLLVSAPGGGKSSLMRIFNPKSLSYIQETAPTGGPKQCLSEMMEDLGAFQNGKPYALGIWLRMSDEYIALQYTDASNQHGLFCAMLNARIILSALIGICELKGLQINKELHRISFSLGSQAESITASSWTKWGADKGDALYSSMAELEANLCDIVDDPFWDGSTQELAHNSGLWSLDLLSNLSILMDDEPLPLQPLVMLDDAHELSEGQLKYLLSLFTSRQLALPFWMSVRKQAFGLQELLSRRLGRGVEAGRDYQYIDLEESKGEFRKRVLEISKLRVQDVAAEIGALSQVFVDFVSDERESFLDNLNSNVAKELKDKVLASAGPELPRFQSLINEIEASYTETHDLCRRLRMLEILIQREVNKPQKSFNFHEMPSGALKKSEQNKAFVEAAELFLAKEFKLPYYFGAKRLIVLASSNIQQFLRLAGALFDEIIMAIRLDKDADSRISPERQNAIITKMAKNFLDEIPVSVLHGNKVSRLIQAIGQMSKHETYRPTASYAPGVTGTALTMRDYEMLYKRARKGDNACIDLFQAIESAVAHNILEPVQNYKCKGKEFLVLYLNRLLCAHFRLPIQKGGFREKSLSTLLGWMEHGYENRQRILWE